jgi:hypothetical protein
MGNNLDRWLLKRDMQTDMSHVLLTAEYILLRYQKVRMFCTCKEADGIRKWPDVADVQEMNSLSTAHGAEKGMVTKVSSVT